MFIVFYNKVVLYSNIQMYVIYRHNIHCTYSRTKYTAAIYLVLAARTTHEARTQVNRRRSSRVTCAIYRTLNIHLRHNIIGQRPLDCFTKGGPAYVIGRPAGRLGPEQQPAGFDFYLSEIKLLSARNVSIVLAVSVCTCSHMTDDQLRKNERGN